MGSELSIKAVSQALRLHEHTVRDSVRDLAKHLSDDDKARLRDVAPRLRF